MESPPPARYPEPLVAAAAALAEQRLDVAERILKPYLKDDPFDVRAIRMLAELAARLGRLKDSEGLLRRAVEIAPDWNPARINLALVLGRLGRPGESMEIIDEIVAAEPDGPDLVNLRAATLGRLGEFEQGVELYEQAIASQPKQPRVWMSYAHMLKTIGRQADAVAAYRRALVLKPTLGEAWWSLANLKTVRFEKEDIDAMQAALAESDIGDDDRFHLDFALGKAFHDARESDAAFAHYAAGNALRRRYHPYRSSDVTQLVARSIETFTAEVFASAGGCEAIDPIFILGMPRAGSTLVEQILASHSQVEGTGELADIPQLARAERRYPADAAALTSEERTAIGLVYLERTAIQRRTAKPLFIDKLPNNWMFVPFIHLVLPNAKIIDARRHPLGCCFSNFRQHFARGQDFTYDLGDLGLYYTEYVRLMAHVDDMLPGRVHRVIYERMVDDTEAEVRALLDYCGLEFEPTCLEFYKTDRAVRTASSEQVRRPIYSDSTDEWRNYEMHFGPLIEALGPVLDAYPEAPSDSFATRTK
ncbi:MAG: sulfotransferase [Sphingomicrobium sp.]